MSKSQRTKGQCGEREFLKLFQSLLNDRGIPCTLQRNYDQTAVGGADCVGLPELAIEIKRHETLSVPAWWRQAISQANKLDRIPVLAYRQSRRTWTILVPSSIAPEAEKRSFQAKSGLPPAAIVTPEQLADWYSKRIVGTYLKRL